MAKRAEIRTGLYSNFRLPLECKANGSQAWNLDISKGITYTHTKKDSHSFVNMYLVFEIQTINVYFRQQNMHSECLKSELQ